MTMNKIIRQSAALFSHPEQSEGSGGVGRDCPSRGLLNPSPSFFASLRMTLSSYLVNDRKAGVVKNLPTNGAPITLSARP